MTVIAEPPLPQAVPYHDASAVPTHRWQRWALAVLLSGVAVLYLWGLNRSGYANTYYSAAAQAGSQSWKAFLFGSSDAANSITIDKPPMSVWPMALAVRIFGLNPWSVLIPQALLGVASVALIWDAVRRRFGESAGLAAGLILALTPVAVAIFRYNNPDAMLTFLTLAAVWALLRAVDDGRTRWLLLCGVCIGLGYLTKQLQVVLLLPAVAVTYLVAGPPALLKRLWQLALGTCAAVLTAGWWIALVQLWPTRSRPWIGGTQHNSIWELTFGYNGLGRLNGDEPGSVAFILVGRGTGPNAKGVLMRPWGVPGIGRMFQPAQIGEIAWLLPAALIFLVALLIWRGRAPRRDVQRASLLAWGVVLVCAALVFSFMAGIFHPYYTVVLAPPIAALTGIGAVFCWRRRDQVWAQATLALAGTATVATAYFVLRRVPIYYPWLRWALVGVAVALMVWLARLGAAWTERRPVRLLVLAAAAVLALAGPLAYSVTTVSRGNYGVLPTGGPSLRALGIRAEGAQARSSSAAAPGGAPRVQGCSLMESSTPEPAIVKRLKQNADSFTWVAATVGSMCASGYQLASGHPVMPIGGYNGTDPAPAPDQFLRLVLAHRIHYFIVTGPIHLDTWGHLGTAALIQQWVQRNYTPLQGGTVRVYDLTQP